MTDPIFKISLSLSQINQLLAQLGELPTRTNMWPIASLIQQQAEDQARRFNEPATGVASASLEAPQVEPKDNG